MNFHREGQNIHLKYITRLKTKTVFIINSFLTMFQYFNYTVCGWITDGWKNKVSLKTTTCKTMHKTSLKCVYHEFSAKTFCETNDI